MAHADYHCCAICDSKLFYGGIDSTTKKTICPTCLKSLRSVGLSILDTKELIAWIESQSIDIVKQTLQAVVFQFCYYLNEVDEAVEAKGINKSLGKGINGR